ncbi:uncharacterized protein [Elaeis guineensis]|uniref:DNA-directed RNA polymerases I and III subunit RPAC2 n=1 Tax=Elaeis guineensis var. tenera TaxID=51953 RepID=A0A6I9QKT4_ELAGV|nr:DNA-directed RNA polymerases I and III subunit RPAC2 [Elaeis guineensis]
MREPDEPGFTKNRSDGRMGSVHGTVHAAGGVDIVEGVAVPCGWEQRRLLSGFLLFGKREFAMEHGSLTDLTSSTFSLMDEDHTLANSVRFTLNQDPRVAFCGYSIPHPSDNKVNIRIQTTGDTAKDVLKDALQNLMVMCQHVRTTFDKAVADYETNQPSEHMNIDTP